jgi:hypothetical protein
MRCTLASGSPRARALAAHALGDVTEPEKQRAVDALILALGRSASTRRGVLVAR